MISSFRLRWPASVLVNVAPAAVWTAIAAQLFLSMWMLPVLAHPTQAVQLVVPFSAGSTLDIVARVLATKLSGRWGQSVVVENRPGVAGTASVAKAPNDGHTLMIGSNGLAAIPFLNSKLSFDPIRDFSGVAQVAGGPMVMLIDPKLPQKTLREFIDYAKQHPGTWNFASNGYGSVPYILGASFNEAAGVNIVHVPYKGGPEALTAVLRGDSQLYFAGPNFAAEFVATGKLRGLAVTGPERLASIPDVPTVEEAGLKGFSYLGWIGIFVPAGTPENIREKISKDLQVVLDFPDVRDTLASQGLTAPKSNPSHLDQLLREEAESLARVLKKPTE